MHPRSRFNSFGSLKVINSMIIDSTPLPITWDPSPMFYGVTLSMKDSQIFNLTSESLIFALLGELYCNNVTFKNFESTNKMFVASSFQIEHSTFDDMKETI